MRSKSKIKTKNRRAVRAQKELDRRQKNLKKQKKCTYCKRRLEEKPKHITYSKGRFKCHRKKQRRVTLLLGAGAVLHLKYLDHHGIEQEAISSSEIKDLIVNDTRYITKTNSITVGKYLFGCLEKHFVDDSGVNFETFLAVLESLYDFVMDSTSENKKAVFNLFNPIIYTFLKQNTNDSFNINELNEDPDDREFFFNLWAYYYKLVVDSIANYSNRLTDSINSALNESFRESDHLPFLRIKI